MPGAVVERAVLEPAQGLVLPLELTTQSPLAAEVPEVLEAALI